MEQVVKYEQWGGGREGVGEGKGVTTEYIFS
jgi:hypothetical protein